MLISLSSLHGPVMRSRYEYRKDEGLKTKKPQHKRDKATRLKQKEDSDGKVGEDTTLVAKKQKRKSKDKTDPEEAPTQKQPQEMEVVEEEEEEEEGGL